MLRLLRWASGVSGPAAASYPINIRDALDNDFFVLDHKKPEHRISDILINLKIFIHTCLHIFFGIINQCVLAFPSSEIFPLFLIIPSIRQDRCHKKPSRIIRCIPTRHAPSAKPSMESAKWSVFFLESF